MSKIILKVLLGAAGPLLAAILNAINGAGVFEKVMILAEAEVARLDGETMDEFEKRKQATLALRDAAKKVGLQVRDSVLDVALSMAIAGLRVGFLKK